MKLPSVYITMLGTFQITIGDKTISDQNHSHKKPFLLLQYLIAHRKKNIPQNDIIEALWPQEDITNPAASLKTLIYRARKVLSEFHMPNIEFICQSGGSYGWNPSLPTILDIDLFERYINEGNNTKLPVLERLAKYKNAIALYEGDFLPRISFESWVVPISSYYHAIYLKLVHNTLLLLLDLKLYEEMTSLCKKTLEHDLYDEEIHYYLILSLLQLKNRKSALQHYIYTYDLFYNKFGVVPSDKIRSLHKRILESNDKIQTNMTFIIDTLEEVEEIPGPFYCDYNAFRDIYQFQQRSCKRTGAHLYLGVITIHNQPVNTLEIEETLQLMHHLRTSIQNNIRSTDIFTRFNNYQYLILLPHTEGIIGDEVMKRIIRYFYSKHTYLNAKISYTNNDNVLVSDVRKKI